MPELPEVESIRLSLLPAVLGRIISDVEILTPGVFLAGDMPQTGWVITALERRGKFLIFRLSGADSHAARLVVHLRMTGQLLIQTEKVPPQKHTHVILMLSSPAKSPPAPPIWLAYHDTRRFGRLWLLPESDGGMSSLPGVPGMLDRLGPEPLDASFDAALLSDRLKHHTHARLKPVLLDQAVVAGLGNIYADEVLFAAKLNPKRHVASLAGQEIADLVCAIRQVIQKAITCQGTSLRDFVDAWNQKGEFQDCLMVYGRAGQSCRRCGSIIEKTKLAGRTTSWCPFCQPEHEHPGESDVRP